MTTQTAMNEERAFLAKKLKGSLATRKFRAFLKKEGITQATAAQKMGMNEEMLSRYLNGDHLPGLHKAKLISDLTYGIVGAFDWIETD